MRKLYAIPAISLLALSFCASAQAPVEGDNNAPIKFEDVVRQYQKKAETPQLSDAPVGEGANYHFERWKWYWENHLDENGYMVSPVQNYMEAQKLDRAQGKTTADRSDWKFMGPTSSPGGYEGIGRINCIEFHPTNDREYWVGSAGGGAWKTTDDGQTWTAMSDGLAVLGVSDVDINPKRPNTIYLCPGDRDGSDTYSIGVLKSTDGGQTWNTTGLQWNTSQFRLTNTLVINPDDTSSLTLAASNGIYKSYDAGQTWNNVQSGHFKQVIYKPGDTATLYATRYGSGNGDIYRSVNGGASWTRVLNVNARRATIAVSPANSSLVRAVIANNAGGLLGVYESTNSGASFTAKYSAGQSGSCTGNLISGNFSGNGCGRQGYYDLTIAISPTNTNTMFVGGVNTWGSTNGGTSWNLTTQWWNYQGGIATVHADKHMHAYHPRTGALYECNDGGIYKTLNPQSQLWTDLTNGMGITQFYRTAVPQTATYGIAGSQDNGSKREQGTVWTAQGGGDGMDCQVDPVDSNVFYTSTQYGRSILRTTNGGQSRTNIRNNINPAPSAGWITPFILSPNNNRHIIAGYKEIFFSSDRGDNWMSLTGSNIHGNSNARRLAMSGGTNPVIYAVYNNDRVYYSKNFVPGNTTTFDTIQVPYSGTISDIQVHPTDSAHFYLTYSGYNSPGVVEYNKGVWTQMKVGLPNVPVRCFAYDSSNNIIYAGTDIAVYYMDTSTNGQWASFRKNMPNIEITDLAINYSTDEIWASTYGRGLWKSEKQYYGVKTVDTTDTTVSVAVIPYSDDVFVIAPNPNNGSFKVIVGKSVATGQDITVSIIDYAGKNIMTTNTTISGSRKVDVKTIDIPSGLYIVELRNNKAVIGRKRLMVR